MTDRERISRRLRRLIKDARAVGLVFVADASDTGAIRIMSKQALDEAEDLRDLGEAVAVDGACGGGIKPSKDGSGNG